MTRGGLCSHKGSGQRRFEDNLSIVFRSEIQKPDLFAYDLSFRKKGYRLIAGLDEVGRGPLAGPVVAAAVILPRDFFLDGLRDSKKVPAGKRAKMFLDILVGCLDVGVGIIEPAVIDQVNILEGTKLAMQAALMDLRQNPDLLLIDALRLESIDTDQMAIIKGDDTSASIAAASIVAKEVRDGIMCAYHKQYPQYHFHKHKGYPTKLHKDSLRKHGPCIIHRKTFSGVMQQQLPF